MKKLFLLCIINSCAFAQTFVRTSLLEEFTGESCPPCAYYNPGLDSTLALHPGQVIPIKWMVPIPVAPIQSYALYQTNRAEIDWRYGSAANGCYGYMAQYSSTNNATPGILNAPTVFIDGRHQWNFGATSDHPFFTRDSVINAAQSQTTNFAINISAAWNNAFTSCAVTVTVQSSIAFTAAGPLFFRLCLIERTIDFSNPTGTNGEKTFHNAVRQSYPTTTTGTAVTSMGTALPATWAANQTQTFVINCLAPSYIVDNTQMAFVGFVQDDGTKFIYQAARSDQAVTTTGLNAIGKPDEILFDVYPNPASAEANILLSAQGGSDINLGITNATGQLVYSKQYKISGSSSTLNLDCKNLPAGIYNVVIGSDKKTGTKKLIISK